MASGIPAAHLAHPPRPIEGVWPEILLPLQANPKATAKPLFERLDRAYPGRFARAQMRTLQRRIREWRRVMACELVYRRLGKEGSGHEPVVLGVDTAASPENPRDASLTPQEIQ